MNEKDKASALADLVQKNEALAASITEHAEKSAACFAAKFALEAAERASHEAFPFGLADEERKAAKAALREQVDEARRAHEAACFEVCAAERDRDLAFYAYDLAKHTGGAEFWLDQYAEKIVAAIREKA